MKQLFYFLAAIIGGLLLHQTSSITRKMPKGWQELTGTAIGVQGTLPFFLLLLQRLGFGKDALFRIAVIYEAVYLCVGSGVALGWMLDGLQGVDREAPPPNTN